MGRGVSRPAIFEQRARIAEKIMDWGNLVFVGLVIAQIVPGTNQFRLSVAVAGFLCIAISYWSAYLLLRGGDR
jgi:hypothetical protein